MKHVNNYQRILVSGLLFVLILVMLIAASKGSYKILVADLFSQNLNVLQNSLITATLVEFALVRCVH